MEIKRGLILHDIFETAIFLKGLNGIFQLVLGLVILFISLSGIHNIANMILQQELTQDPSDPFANFIINFTQTLNLSTKEFIGIYLLIHGILNLFIMISLWKEKHWAYPTSGVIIALMIIYQIIRYTHTHSLTLIIITLIDMVILSLLLQEYHKHWKSRST